MKKVYAVKHIYGNNDAYVWTISTSPNETGWETDSGCYGYGLSKEAAEFYAKCINYCVEHGVQFE